LDESLDPHLITDHLGMQPTSVCIKGQPWIPEGKLSAKTGGWIFSTDKVVYSRSLNRHLSHLTKLLSPKVKSLSEFKENGYKISVGCYLLTTDNVVVTISQANLCRLAALGLELWFDLYPGGDADQRRLQDIPGAKPERRRS